jgi:mannan endo-1,4-beta-mannosidase
VHIGIDASDMSEGTGPFMVNIRGRLVRWLTAAAAVTLAVSALGVVYRAESVDSPTPVRAAATGTTHGFLTRSGRRLMLDGQPYKFVGVNAFGLTGCDGASTDTSVAGLEAYFASLRPKSITRTWAFQPQGAAAVARVVAAAEKYNQMVVFALADGANYCDDDGHDAAFYAGGFRGAYLSWVREVVAPYRGSPAVAMWEIMNEPRGAANDTVMKTFFDETAALLKSLAPDTLVSTGTLGEYISGTQNYALVHGGPNIDVGSLHEYDYHTSNGQIISGHFGPTIAAMNSIDKPMYIGESGVTAADSGCLARSARVDVFRQKFDGYLNGGAVGVLPWSYRTVKNNSCDYYGPGTIYPGDPLMPFIKGYDIPGVDDPTDSITPSPSPSSSPSPSRSATPVPSQSSTPAPTGPVNDTAFGYSGTWRTGDGTGKYQSDDHYSDATGATYSLTFTGTRAKVYFTVAPHHGIAAVSIDGAPESTVDLYRATRAEQQALFTSPVLAAGSHTVRVRVTGTRNAASTGTVVTADRIDITG